MPSNGAVVTRARIAVINARGELASGCRFTARKFFWLDARVAAKFDRASIVDVENQLAPSGQPPTFGGSYNACPMLASGARARSSEKFCQPSSLMARTTYSTGHEKRA